MKNRLQLIGAAAIALNSMALGQTLPDDIKVKAEAKIAQLKTWGNDPQVVSAVQAYNQSPSAEAKGMTNEKWKGLTMLDPAVRSFSKNGLRGVSEEQERRLHFGAVRFRRGWRESGVPFETDALEPQRQAKA